MSLSHTPPTEETTTADDSYMVSQTESTTPRQLNFSTPAGAYNFMNANFVEQPPQLPHLSSPMDLLILGSRRGNDGIIRDELDSFNSSPYPANINSKSQKKELSRKTSYQEYPVFSPKTPHSDLQSFNSSSSFHNSSSTPTVVGSRSSLHQEQTPVVFSPDTTHSETPHLATRSSVEDGGFRRVSDYQNSQPVFTPNTPQISIFQEHMPESHHARLHTPGQPNSNQAQFFGPGFSSKSSDSTPSSKQPPITMDLQTELKARFEKEKRKSESPSKPSIPRRQSSLRSRHKEVKEILAYMEPLSNVENSGTTNEKFLNKTPNKYEENVQNQVQVLPNHDSSTDSSPNNHLSSPYQPSKTVAAQLQSRRPTTMYDFPITSQSAAETPTRPISIVEPFSKPVIPAPKNPSWEQDVLKLHRKQENLAKKPVPLPVMSPSGREVDVFHINHTPTALTPKTSLNGQFPDPPKEYSVVSTFSMSPTKATNNFSNAEQTPSKVVHIESDSPTRTPSSFPFSPAQLLAAGKSLRKTTPKDKEDDNLQTSKKSIIKPVSSPNYRFVTSQPINFKSCTPNPIPYLASTSTSEVPASGSVPVAVKSKPVTSGAEKPIKTNSNEAKLPDIGTLVKLSPVKKPPVAAKPSLLHSMKKPAIRPKPLLSPRPNSQVVDKATTNNGSENKQQATKSSDLKTKNATIRAKFFGLTSTPCVRSTDKSQKPTETMKDKIITESTEEKAIADKERPEETTEPKKVVDEYLETSVSAQDISENIASLVVAKLGATETSNTDIVTKTDNTEKESSDSVDSIPSLTSSASFSSEADSMKQTISEPTSPTEQRICNGIDHEDKEKDQNGDSLTADDFDSSLNKAKPDLKVSLQK